MGLNLLEKTELWINNITLNEANLTEISDKVADVLCIEKSKVLVVDVRPHHITVDILEKEINEENIFGKEKYLLQSLSEIKGVNVSDDTYIHSNGILGVICVETDNKKEIIKNINTMVNEIKDKISKRAIVYPTGFELKEKLIEDTNTPFLKAQLEKEGYKVTVGDIIDDDSDEMTYRLSEAVSRAFGVIITTGGVGAEDKDKSIESILRLDPYAATPYIVKFQQGTGRHVKDGVRIAVGKVGPSFIIALPGPHDEVQASSRVLLECLKNNCDKTEIANKIAEVLAEKLTLKKFCYKKDNNESNIK